MAIKNLTFTKSMRNFCTKLNEKEGIMNCMYSMILTI